MAVLKNGTTIGGNAAIHAANMADHGIITTSTVGSQSVNYATSAGNADTVDSVHASSFVRNDVDQPTVQRHFDASTTWTNGAVTLFLGWYSNKVVIGNGSEDNHDNAAGLGGNTVAITNTLYSFEQSNLYYDGSLKLYMGSDGTRNTGWAYHNDNSTGLHWPNNGWHLMPADSSDFRIYSGNATSSALRFETQGTTRGYVYAENDNSIGFLNNGRGWILRAYSDNSVVTYGHYLTVGNGRAWSSILMHDSDEGTREIHCNSNRIGFLTQAGSWGAWADDSANWFSNGYIQSFSSMYSPIYYDGNDSSFYGDFAGTSKLYRITNTGALGGNELNARNHFRQFNAGTDAPSSGWIAAAFGDESANRVVIGQWGSTTQAIIGSHTGGLDDWGPLGYAATEHKFYSPTWETERVRVDSSGLLVSNGTIRLGGYIEQDGISMNLRRVNSITFAPNNSWDHPYNHGIMSTDSASNNSDCISINSWNDITLRLDSNDNNGESYLRIMNNTAGSNTIAYIGHDGGSAVAWFQGVVTAGNDFRAPIFYDSQDTGYYGDFAGYSRMSEIGVTNHYVYNYDSIESGRTTAEWGNVGKYVATRSGAGDYPSFSFEHANGNHSWGIVARYHIRAGSGSDRPSIQFSNGQTNTRWNIGYNNPDDNFRISQNMGYRPDGSGTSDGWGTERFLLDTSGNIYIGGLLQSSSSLRAPIFYDSNDTSYYVDPNGASNLKTVTFNSSGANSDVLAVNGVNGRLFTVTDDLTDSLFSVNTIAGLPAMEIFADNKIVLGKYGTTAPSNYINSTLIIKDAQENASAQTLGLIGSKSAGAAIGFFTNDLGYPYPDDQARFAQISLNNGNWEFYSGGGIPVIFNQSPVLLSERIEVSGVVYAWDRLAVNTDNFSYTATDNTPVVGSTTNNKVFISGSIQLLDNNDAIVFGRGTSTFLKDEELAFGWGGGWYMVDTSYIRSRNGKSLHMNGASVDYVGSLYLEGSGTGGHLQPNAGSYGTLQITGSKNSWAGLRFAETAVTLMMNTNESGHHNDNYGWQFRWYNGTLYCHKNSNGGGTVATVLDSSNFTSWAAEASHSHSYVPLSGGTLSGNLLTHDVFPTEDRVYDLGRDTGRYRIVYCETLDSAGLHETNLESEGLDQLETGTVLVWKGGKNLPCTIEADHMRMGIAVYGHNAPLVQGAEPVLCTGEVNEGDYLITSAKEGHAKAVNRAYIVENQLFDCVLGKALETASGESHLVKTWITI